MAEFDGSLHIFVDRPEPVGTGATETDADAGSVFDARQAGSLLWFQVGLAVGKNARGSYCARTSLSKLRAFPTFAEAMDFVRKKRKSRPQERFHLVYDRDGRKTIVTSLAQIQQLDQAGGSGHALSAGVEEPVSPELSMLSEKVGRIVARNAWTLLKILRAEGEEVARSRFSSATYDRLQGILQGAGLLNEGTM